VLRNWSMMDTSFMAAPIEWGAVSTAGAQWP